jgi:hypothetical protein
MNHVFIKALTPTVKVKKPAKPAGAKAPDTSHYAGLLGILSDHKPESKFGPDTVQKGHKVAFKAGTFVGGGKVSSTGKDGLTVQDDDAREHRVHWHEVTGHHDGKTPKAGKDAEK